MPVIYPPTPTRLSHTASSAAAGSDLPSPKKRRLKNLEKTQNAY
jgi:hypothetical protein